MATMFFVQGFRLRGRKLEPGAPQAARSPEAAIAAAERLAPARAALWAYSQNTGRARPSVGTFGGVRAEPAYMAGRAS